MARKGILLLLCLLVCPLVDGQSLKWRLTTDNQNLVEESIAPAFSIIRQEFQLQDVASGQKYNLDSLSYFGYSEAICIRTADGFITSRSVLSPWEKDINIRDFPEYKPTRSTLSEYDGNSRIWKTIGSPSYDNYRELNSSEKIYVCDSIFAGKGLEIDLSEGQRDAWLVWIYRKGDKLSFQSFRQRYNPNDSTGKVPAFQPEDGLDILTGVLLTTDYSEIGVIRFKLAAIIERISDEWKVIGITTPTHTATEEHTLIPVQEAPAEKITAPAEKKNPRRKKK